MWGARAHARARGAQVRTSSELPDLHPCTCGSLARVCAAGLNLCLTLSHTLTLAQLAEITWCVTLYVYIEIYI